jgi:hypothetical protein
MVADAENEKSPERGLSLWARLDSNQRPKLLPELLPS